MTRRAWTIAAVTLAVVVAAALAVWVATGDDDETNGTTPTTAATTTTAPSSTTSVPGPTTTVPPITDPTVMWPFPASTTRYATPAEAARSFATEFLGFDDPLVGDFRQGDSRSGEVPIRPRAQGPETTVLVRQVGPGDSWFVLGAATANIEVDEPGALAEISSPVPLRGRAHAFEGTVQVEVREDGQLGAIGESFVTGGGDELRPFQGTVEFRSPGAPRGAVVFLTRSAENGQVWEAAAVRVAFGTGGVDTEACGDYRPPRPQPGPEQMEVKAFFNCGADAEEISPFAVYRLVPRSPQVLRASLEALLAGPTDAESGASLSSWFSSETEGMLRSVVITDGHAVVDFEDLRPVIPNASTSAGSALLLSQLDATVFQFATVRSVEYRIEGSCEAFTEWLQFGGCERRTRAEPVG